MLNNTALSVDNYELSSHKVYLALGHITTARCRLLSVSFRLVEIASYCIGMAAPSAAARSSGFASGWPLAALTVIDESKI